MGDFFRGIIAFLGIGVVLIGSLAIQGFYLVAFRQGAHEWWNIESGFIIVAAIAAMMFLGPIGTIFVAVVGGYGAYYGWDWPLWLTLIVFFPGFAFMIGGVTFSLIGSLFSRRAA